MKVDQPIVFIRVHHFALIFIFYAFLCVLTSINHIHHKRIHLPSCLWEFPNLLLYLVNLGISQYNEKKYIEIVYLHLQLTCSPFGYSIRGYFHVWFFTQVQTNWNRSNKFNYCVNKYHLSCEKLFNWIS